jgi:hypothetical protein
MTDYKNYVNVCAIFRDKDCRLTETEESLKEKQKTCKYSSSAKVTFIASCGHENTVTLTNFVSKSSGVLCKNCVKEKVRCLLVDSYKGQEDRTLKQEYTAFKEIEQVLEERLDVMKTNEGCLADFVCKPKCNENNRWMKIQLKTTIAVCHNLYTFGIHKNNYVDHMMLCMCIEEAKMWLIPHSDIAHIQGQKLNIGAGGSSKYNMYKVSSDNLADKLKYYYENTKKFPLHDCMIPQSVYQQRELIYRKRMQSCLQFIDFNFNICDGLCYDFMIGRLKIQEKVASKHKDKRNGYIACLWRTGETNSHRHKKPYERHMNEFYWVHIPDSEFFYVFPENELYERGYIVSNSVTPTRSLMLYISIVKDDAWYSEYKFSYDKPDEGRIIELMKI